jgi:hypothetical protein
MVRKFVAIAALAAVMGVAQAATLLDTDFTKGSTGWTLNGTAKLLDPQTAGVTQVLSLTQNAGNQTGTAWTDLNQKVDSFSFTVDARIRYASKDPDGNDVDPCPADGIAFAFAPVDADLVGGGGGSVSLFDGGTDTFTAFVINTWRGQGLGTDDERAACTSGKNETFEFDVANPNYGADFIARTEGSNSNPDQGGSKINQVNPPSGMKLVNGGFYRYQLNVDSATNTMTVYATGLEDSNKQFQKVKVNEATFDPAKVKILDFTGRWGLAAATGGAVQSVDISHAKIDVPMIDPQ